GTRRYRDDGRSGLSSADLLLDSAPEMQLARKDAHVLVTATGDIDDKDIFGQRDGSETDRFGDGVRALKCGYDAFGAREHYGCIECLLVRGGGICGAPGIVHGCMLRADGGVVESRRDRVGKRNLAVIVLQNIGEGALQHAR